MPANGELSTDAQTLGKLFRSKGYYTGYKGKWHLAPVAFPIWTLMGSATGKVTIKHFGARLEVALNLMNRLLVLLPSG